MTTVLFIHGTGVRVPAFDTMYARIRDGLAKERADIGLARCYWGEIGASLQADGKSFYFDPARTRDSGGTEDQRAEGRAGSSVPEEERELARWARLFTDPLFEIRLRQVAEPEAGELFGGREVRDRILELPGKPGVQTELAAHGLTDAFTGAVTWLTESDEFRSVYGRSTVKDGITEAMLSRALVARCLAVAADDGVELTGAGRDQLVTAVQAGFGAPDAGLADGLGDLAKDLAFRAAGPSLRKRRWDSIRATGDILLYQAQGDAIRDFVRRRIGELDGPVVLLAHSLGGIVAFDLLATAGSADLDQVRLLVTVGSQAPLLYELGALSCGIKYPMPLPGSFRARWVNVYDRRDLLAYAGGEFFGDRCHDIPLDTHTPFPTAHSAYWDKPELYRRLAEAMRAEGL
jgi:pimeloyl-ACP methyl ester carboxylesterase